ncbi:hypothetical protein TTHERM_00773390 (macronuclear) [Tetrahymena thermophila SB210]|uniref:E3 ubiquitin-protein ligase n=1 Tax=Tetrahymena thermophila (strain SB210) TaxID=312017 RepID=I7LZH2_TETTS|nr:hypothetical protein TTHERM_00773390 [Tetrahymena thermophila SB210]EAR83929.2 hypothetical protein TTHERM_00773390 [Tetrahymena thermophila SB210]|eukprot:XP_001031592.2 hypothetical protein TTHERM_00773390 [Tetrahymena thermophila SB210]
MIEQESLKQLIDPLFRFGEIQSKLIEIMLRRCLIYESPTLIYKILSNINKHELDCLLYNFKNNICSVFELIYNPAVSKRSRKNWLQVVILFVKKFDLTLPAHHELILHILKVSTYPDSKRNRSYQEVEYNERLNWMLLMKIFRRVSKNKILMQKIYSNFELKKQEVDEVNSYAYSEDYFTTVAHLRLVLLVSLLYQTIHGNVTSTPKARHFPMLKFSTFVQQNQQQIPSAMNLSQQLFSQHSQSIFNHQSSLTQNYLLNQNQQQITNLQNQNQQDSNNPQQQQNQGSLTPNNNNIKSNNNNNNNNNTNWIVLNNNGKQTDNLSCHSLLNNQSFVFNVNQNQSPQQTAIKHQNTYGGTNNYGNQLNENGKASNKLIQLNKNEPVKIKDKKIIENFFQKSILLKCDRQKQNHYDWMFSSEWFLVQFWMPQLCSSDDLLKKQVSLNKNLNPQLFLWIQKNLHMLVQEVHEFLFLSKFKIFNNNYKELLKKVILSFLFENQNKINCQDQVHSLETLQAINQSSSPKQNTPTSSIASFSMHRMRQNIKKINKSFKQILSVDISKLSESFFVNYLSYDWRSNTVKPSGEFPQYDPGIFYKDHSKNKIVNIIENIYFQINSQNSNSQNSLDQTQQLDFLLGNMKALSTVSKVLENIFSIDFVQILLNKQLIQKQFIIPIMRTVSLILQYSPITNQILFHESVDRLINLLDTSNAFNQQLKKQIQCKLQKIKRTRKEEMQNPNSQNQDNYQQNVQDDQQFSDYNPSLLPQAMKHQQGTKTLQNNQQNQNQINQSKTSSINNTQNTQQEKARQAQRQILEEFKRRQQQFSQQNQIKEMKKVDQINNKQPQEEIDSLVCNICSESYIKRRIFYINCYIQLDNYYKSYKGLKTDIKQQHNFYLTTCNHLMHKDCIIQHIRTSNQYESLLQENEYFCQCCFRLNNIFVPYLEQYERVVRFQYNPLKQVLFVDELSYQQNQEETSSEGDAQQIDNMEQGIITSQLPKNPQLPFPLDQIDQKNMKYKQITQQGKKKSHAVGFFNFQNNYEDSSFMQIIQQIESVNDKNGFVNENSPQKLLDKNSDFQKCEKQSRQELEMEKIKFIFLQKQIEDGKRKTENNNNQDVAQDEILQGNAYLIKKKQSLTMNKQGQNKQGIKSLKYHSQNKQNETHNIKMKTDSVQQPQYKNNQQEIIVEEKKESSIQEEDRVLTDYFEPEVDISYLEDMNLRLQHIDIRYNNILLCFQSLLINQIEESMTNTNQIQDYNMLKESFIKSKQFNVSRNLFLYLKVWSFIEDRDSIHEAYYLSQKELIENIQFNDYHIYQVSLGKKSNFASILVNLMILFLNKEEAFLSLSAKFIYKYLIFDIIIEKSKYLKELDIIPDPLNFSQEISENLLKNFKELIDYRFLQITYCVWMIYYGKKNQKNIEIFLNSMISSDFANDISQDSYLNENTFNILAFNQNQKSNILLPENTIINNSQSIFKVPVIKNFASIADVAKNLLNQQILDDLFYISINKKISQFNNYKQFQLQLTLNLQVSYSDFIQCHFFGKCSICHRYPQSNQEGYYMCLICNSNLCAKHFVNITNKKSTNQQNNQQITTELKKQYSNTLIEHTQQHHSGMSMYLNYSSSQVVIVRDSEMFIQRQLLLYKDQIGRPPNINNDWKNQVQICNNTQKELQDLINKKDFDQKCMQIKRILFDQQLDQQEILMRRMLMNNENQVEANNQTGVQNRQNSNQQRQIRQQQRVINNQLRNQQDGLSLNQQQDTQTLDLNQQDRIANINVASNQNSQNLQGVTQNINSNSNSNNNINNNQLYTNQQNFSSNVFTTLNF